ncbi:MAG: hypothetical protein GY847_33465, partial [Proteobacteria bacterium]|nr:hypothetical protein [Pseudomonadota bacterium]
MYMIKSVVLVLAISAATWAAVPLDTGFTYQGKIYLLGAPLNDTADFEFSLYDDPSTGTQVG